MYLDRNTLGLYRCVRETATTDNNSDFERVDLNGLSDKLQNLVINLGSVYIPTGSLLGTEFILEHNLNYWFHHGFAQQNIHGVSKPYATGPITVAYSVIDSNKIKLVLGNDLNDANGRGFNVYGFRI